MTMFDDERDQSAAKIGRFEGRVFARTVGPSLRSG